MDNDERIDRLMEIIDDLENARIGITSIADDIEFDDGNEEVSEMLEDIDTHIGDIVKEIDDVVLLLDVE